MTQSDAESLADELIDWINDVELEGESEAMSDYHHKNVDDIESDQAIECENYPENICDIIVLR